MTRSQWHREPARLHYKLAETGGPACGAGRGRGVAQQGCRQAVGGRLEVPASLTWEGGAPVILHHDNLVDGHDAEGRCANVLRTMEGDESEPARSARWAIRNWLRARRAVKEAANLTPDPDVQRVLAEALEVVDDEDEGEVRR